MAIHHGIAPISVFGLGFTPEIWVFSSPFLVIICEGPHYLVTITFSSPNSFMSYCFLVTSLKTCECYGSFLFCASLSLLTLALRPPVFGFLSWISFLFFFFRDCDVVWGYVSPSWLWLVIQVSICSHRHFRSRLCSCIESRVCVSLVVPVLFLVVVASVLVMSSMILNTPSAATSLPVFNINS